MDLLMQPLNAQSSVPIYKQLSNGIRDAVLSERLKPGQPVPSLRELTDLAHVCRATALKAHEDLQNQGLIATDAGRRSIVTFKPEDLSDASVSSTARSELLSFPLSTLSEAMVDVPTAAMSTVDCGDLALLKIWKKLSMRHVETAFQVVSNTAALNVVASRAKSVVQDYLIRTRAVVAERSQMRFSSSNDFLLFLIARVLVNTNKRVQVILGAGSSPMVRTAFHACGADVIECPVDDRGLDVDNLRGLLSLDQEHVLTCIYVNPSHHFSTGVLMPVERRHQLIATARSSGSVIFEDDIESENRYAKNPLPSIQGMANGVDVFYLSSLNALMPPLVRVALLVVPERFVSAFNSMSGDDDVSCLTLAALADLVDDGHLEVHMNTQRKARMLLKQKMIYVMTKYMRGKARVITHTVANRQVFSLDSDLSADRMIFLAEACGLRICFLGDCVSGSRQFAILLDEIENEFEEKFCQWSKLLSSEDLNCDSLGGVS